MISRTRPSSRFSACNIKKLGMGLGTRLVYGHCKHAREDFDVKEGKGHNYFWEDMAF